MSCPPLVTFVSSGRHSVAPASGGAEPVSIRPRGASPCPLPQSQIVILFPPKSLLHHPLYHTRASSPPHRQPLSDAIGFPSTGQLSPATHPRTPDAPTPAFSPPSARDATATELGLFSQPRHPCPLSLHDLERQRPSPGKPSSTSRLYVPVTISNQ